MDTGEYFRYVVNVSFKQNLKIGDSITPTIAESVKTLKEAQHFKTLMDNSVAKACVVDKVTGQVVEWWIK